MKLQLASLLFALGYLPPLRAQVTFDPINGHYYEVVAANGITWDHANAVASSLNYAGFPGHLVTIGDSEENTFISGLLNFPSLAYWAGGYQDPKNPLSLTDSMAGWKWVHNEGAIPTDNSGLARMSHRYWRSAKFRRKNPKINQGDSGFGCPREVGTRRRAFAGR